MLKQRRVNNNNKNNVETDVLIITIRIMLKQRRVNNNNKNNVETETC